MRRWSRTLPVTGLAFVIACGCVAMTGLARASGSPPLPKATLFQALNKDNVGEVRTRINGSANDRNQIPVGTVLVYRTSEGNIGKLQIRNYGYDLRIRWVTYGRGTIVSRGDNLLIRGTYLYDLDRGAETKFHDRGADFWWEQVDAVQRYLVSENGASFTIVS